MEKLIPDPFLKNQIPGCQFEDIIDILYNLFLLYARYYQNILKLKSW